MNFKIAVIAGDGIGPEIIEQAIKILRTIGRKFGHNFEFIEVLAGGRAIDEKGEPLPEKSMEICKNSNSILLGAIGGPKWDSLDGDKRPEQALLKLRKELGLYANIRPVKSYPVLENISPFCKEITGNNIDLCIVRELTGGIYFGNRGVRKGSMGIEAYDTEIYNEKEIERIAKIAFKIAVNRRKKVTSVDKSNVLESSRLWRKVVGEISKSFPDVTLEHMLVDNAAMQLIRNPKQFDVILTNNMFGDILSDEASMITGSIGMLPSASIGRKREGLYEPIHGSAPDIAGKNKANPIGVILSAAMMLSYSFGLNEEAKTIEKAVDRVLSLNYRTADIMTRGMKLIGTEEMGELIVQAIDLIEI